VYRRAIVNEVTDTGDMTESVTTETDEHISTGLSVKSDKLFGPPRIPSKRKFEGEDFADYRRVRIRDKPLEWTNDYRPLLTDSSLQWLEYRELIAMDSKSPLSSIRTQYWEPFASQPPGDLYKANMFGFRCISRRCNFIFRVGGTVPEISAVEKGLYYHCSEEHPRECRRLGHDWKKKLQRLIQQRIRDTRKRERAGVRAKERGERASARVRAKIKSGG
jgi:hypothetical protein